VTVALVVVPMLGRPHTVAPLMESLTGDARVVFLCSPDDTDTQVACKASGAEVVVVGWERGDGDYAMKVNLAVRESDEPLLFLGACDLRFHPGWLEAATAKLTPGIGVVGTNDLGNPRVIAGQHSTHSLVTREYANRGLIDGSPGVLFEGYPHEYVDDELVATARKRNAWAFARDSLVEHLHPGWAKAPMDDIYAEQRQRMAVGRVIYRSRRHLWT
jgi:hypothetical protein